jgi:hypothetical protein
LGPSVAEGQEQQRTINESVYMKACYEASKLFQQYKQVASFLLPLSPCDELMSNLQTISLREQWEKRKRRNEDNHKHTECMEMLKQLWPGWRRPSSEQGDPYRELEVKAQACTASVGKLYVDTLQSVLMFLEPTELAACMMVSRSWMSTAKRPRVWAGKVLQIADQEAAGMSTLYSAPWASLALRYVEGVVVVSSQANDRSNDYGYNEWADTHCYNQLKVALRRKALPNIRKVCILNRVASGLIYSLDGNPHVEEVVVGDGVHSFSYSHRVSLLQTMPNLRVARIATFHDLNMWYTADNHKMLCYGMLANRALQHLVVPLENDTCQRVYRHLEDLFSSISQHPSLKTLELQIYGIGSIAGVLAVILEHCGNICGNLEMLHIKQLDRLGYHPVEDGLSTADHLVTIKKRLLTTVLLEKSKMRVQIELLAGALTIKRYRKMLRELPAGAAELAKERVWVRPVKPNSAKTGSLPHFALGRAFTEVD